MEEDEIVVKVNDYNTLKKDLENQKRLCNYLEASGRLLLQENERLKKDLTVAQVSAEMVPQSLPSSANSSSRTYAKQSNSIGKNREALGHELIQSAIPLDVVKHIKRFFDDASSFAQFFTAEVCDGSWHSLYNRISWQPNNVSKGSKEIRDWRGRCIPLHNFKPISVATDYDISMVAAPLLSMEQHAGDDNENGLDIVGAFIPFCPFEEAHQGTLFTFSVDAMKHFIAQSVIHVMRRDHSIIVNTPKANEMVYNFASQSKELTKRFQGVCNQVINNRKMTARNAFFNLLGYDRIFAARSKDSDQDFDDGRFAQVEDAYAKLHAVDANGEKDTSWWRRAPIEDICANHVKHAVRRNVAVKGVDRLFSHEEGRMTFLRFNRYDIDEMDEVSLCSLIRLDAIITDAVDVLKEEIDSKEENPCTNETNGEMGDEYDSSAMRQSRRPKRGKGGRFLKKLLPG